MRSPLLTVSLVILALMGLLLYGREQRARGALAVQLDSAGASTARAERRADSLTAIAVATATDARSWREQWRALKRGGGWDTLTLTDTVPVPVAVLVTADSAIRSCHVALDACELARLATEAVIDSLRVEIGIRSQLDTRPRTAIGASYNPHTTQWGAFIDRDIWRVRTGLTVEPAAQGLRVGLRIGWVF